MSLRTLAILAFVTVLACLAAAWAWSANGGGRASGPDDGALAFPALTAPGAEPAQIDMKSAGFELTLERGESDWLATGHGDYPVSTASVNRLVAEIAGLRTRDRKTSLPERYGLIGLEDVTTPGASSRLVRITGSDGDVLAETLVGQQSRSIGASPAGGTFVRHPDAAEAWLVEGTVTIPLSISQWIGTVLHVPGPEMRRVAIREGDAVVFEAAKAPGEAAYRLVAPAAVAIDDDKVRALAGSLVSTTVENVRHRDDLDFSSPSRTVIFETAAGVLIEARLAEAESQTWVAFSAEALTEGKAETDATAINARTAQWAFLLEASRTRALQTPLADLLLQPQAPSP
jgi:hypothetical protein